MLWASLAEGFSSFVVMTWAYQKVILSRLPSLDHCSHFPQSANTAIRLRCLLPFLDLTPTEPASLI